MQNAQQITYNRAQRRDAARKLDRAEAGKLDLTWAEIRALLIITKSKQKTPSG